jgi:prephenate dehydrogenase
MQPRRHQIIDYLDWQERQLNKLQVEVRLNAPMDADEVKAFGADVVIMATGSQATGDGFQRAHSRTSTGCPASTMATCVQPKR